MLSFFRPRRTRLTNVKLTETGNSANKNPDHGVDLKFDVVITSDSDTTTRPLLVHMGKLEIEQLARLAGVRLAKDNRIQRDSYCRRGHQLISPNVVHWPNGYEQCRPCYLDQVRRRRLSRAARRSK